MGATILLADDSLTIQKVVELTFADSDHDIVSVSSGAELLEQVDEVGPDLVICDVIMPGISGYEVCQQLKNRDAERPVVLMTGTFEPFDRDRARSAGCDDIITKPFEARKLMATVEELLSRSGAEAVPTAPDDDEDYGGLMVRPPSDEGAPGTATEPARAEPPDAAAEGADVGDAEEDSSPWRIEGDAADLDPVDAPADEAWAAEGPGETPAATPEPPDATPGEEPVREVLGAAGATPPPTVPGRPVEEPATSTTPPAGGAALSDGDVDRIARRLLELASDRIEGIAWEVIPDMAELVVRERVRQLEAEVDAGASSPD